MFFLEKSLLAIVTSKKKKPTVEELWFRVLMCVRVGKEPGIGIHLKVAKSSFIPFLMSRGGSISGGITHR